MKRLLILPAVAALTILPACKKKPVDDGTSTEPPKHITRHEADPTFKTPIPAEPATENPLPAQPLATQPPRVRSEKLAPAFALEDPVERENAISIVLLNLPPADAADLTLAELPDDAVREKLLVTVLTRFAIEKPATAAAWLDQAPDFQGKTAAIRATADLWQRLDMAATLKWVDSLPPGSNRQSALDAIAGRIAQSPEEHRSQELNAITNPQLRAEVEALVTPR